MYYPGLAAQMCLDYRTNSDTTQISGVSPDIGSRRPGDDGHDHRLRLPADSRRRPAPGGLDHGRARLLDGDLVHGHLAGRRARHGRPRDVGRGLGDEPGGGERPVRLCLRALHHEAGAGRRARKGGHDGDDMGRQLRRRGICPCGRQAGHRRPGDLALGAERGRAPGLGRRHRDRLHPDRFERGRPRRPTTPSLPPRP